MIDGLSPSFPLPCPIPRSMSRPRQTVSLAEASRPLFAGVDIGGTNIKIGLVDDAGRTVGYEHIPTQADRPAGEACQRAAAAIHQMLAAPGGHEDDCAAVGLATPGPMDIPLGTILTPGNLPAWRNFPIRGTLQEHVGRPVTYANDANAAAFGEYWKGSGANYRSMIMLTLGTGIGGGIIINDRLIDGLHSAGGECGHIVIDCRPDAPVDTAGTRGSLEVYTCAGAVVRRAQESLDNGRPSSLADQIAQGRKLTPKRIAEAATKGDELAREVVFETARYLAIGMISLIHVIDPDSVVLGGAMNFGGSGTPLGQAFLEQIRTDVNAGILEPLRGKINIDFAVLGSDAGYIGAAGLARAALQGNNIDG